MNDLIDRPRTLGAVAASLVLGAGSALAETTHEVLVGSYTGHGSAGIHRFSFDPARGQLGPQPLQVVETDNPSWLVLDGRGSALYAVNENGAGSPDPIGRVSRVVRDASSGALGALAEQVKTLGDHPTHASLSPDGRYLFVANYSAGRDPAGSLAVIPLGDEGALQPVTQLSSYVPSGVHPKRQTGSHVHSAVPSPDGRYLFASDLGADRVFVYRYDPGQRERPLLPADPPFVQLPPGSGPRHLTFNADGKQAYLTLELSAQVMRFDHDEGRLQHRQTLDLAATAGDTREHSPGAIRLSADERFLYVSDRAETNRLVVYAIDAEGTLQEIQQRSSEGREPREFALSPDGRHLLVANQLSDEILVIARDPDSGRLGETLQRLPLSRPSHLLFVR